MHDSIFRQYDIRGKVGSELIIDQVYNLSLAIAFYFKEQCPTIKTVALGMDGRIHSQAIKQQLVQGLLDSGLNVIFIGICPTPVLYFSLFHLPVEAGLMITASHNAYEYNGIKLCLTQESLWGDRIKQIRDLLRQNKRLIPQAIGNYCEYDLIDHYIDWLYTHFLHLVDIDISVLVDCGNGTAGTILPQLIKKMAWPNVTLLYEKVDGTFPHHEPDPTVAHNLEELKLQLSQGDYAFGLGLDGDCDRMAAMTQTGTVIPGDKMLALFSQDVIKRHPGASIVADIKSSSGLMELLDQWGAHTYVSPSGHSLIKNSMKKHNALIGGELSCHFFFKDRYFGYDDGIYAMMRLFEILATSGKTLDELLTIFPQKISSAEIRISCPEHNRQDIIASIKKLFENRDCLELLTIDGVRVTTTYGWGIIRASHTQPMLSLRFESNSYRGFEQIKNDFREGLQYYFDKVALDKHFDIPYIEF
jgi:phosphomannomutase / phosphoglucomutase